MPQARVMSLDEKLAITARAREARKAGNETEYRRIIREELPMAPYMAEFAKSHMGVDFLIKGKYNLTEAEAEFGSDWLTQ